MGQTQSKSIKKQSLTSQHPSFNNAKLLTQSDNKYIQATFLTQNHAYDTWIEQMQKGKKQLTSQYLLLPISTNYSHNQGLCGDSGSLKIKYPYYPHLLSQIIKQRVQAGQYFRQGQLWYMLYALISSLRSIKLYSKKLGDIKPENLFVNDDGKVKVGNVYSWPDQFNSYIKVNDVANNAMFNGLLAPQDIQQLQKGSQNNDKNQFSQIFAIGATILSAGLLSNFKEIYNYQSKTFNVPAFKQKRRQWGQHQNYTNIFKSIVLNLIQKNPGMRLNSQQLWEFVSPYAQSILQKKKFTIQKAPQKVQISFSALLAKNY